MQKKTIISWENLKIWLSIGIVGDPGSKGADLASR